MPSSAIESELDVEATNVVVTDETIAVELEDGRTISVPTAWYPRLAHATQKERANFEISPFGIEWPDVEADLSIRGLLLGRRSGESPEVLKWWLEQRAKGRKATFVEYMKQKRDKRGTKKK